MFEIESAGMVKSLQPGPKVDVGGSRLGTTVALIVRKVKAMEASNNTGCPTTGCLSNVPQFKKQNWA
jgi:hypothetical protein